ncbi:AraC family transcriptional regulator [uncultured Sanguibacteroides sp.]|uniref:helix-turn-helix domain-containing protein n=1 Tax=uncultured Sanguibacteroides sp. TaxID=1635151 RepID=UPI0025D9B95F|nr:AraC family transcriptional regulator [uncultured Sanguibacteroides sp.]
MNTNLCNQKDCSYYNSQIVNGFELYKIPANQTILRKGDQNTHSLFFILSGSVSLSLSTHPTLVFEKGSLQLIPKGYSVTFQTGNEECEILIHRFTGLEIYCKQINLASVNQNNHFDYKFQPFQIESHMLKFLEYIRYSLDTDASCQLVNESSRKVLISIFIQYYSKEDIYQIFYPIMGKNENFRSLVIQNYHKVNNIPDFAKETGCSLSTFKRKFKTTFGESAYKWLQTQRAKEVEAYLQDIRIDFADIIEEFRFTSHKALYHFCRMYLDASPSEIRKKATSFLKQEQVK